MGIGNRAFEGAPPSTGGETPIEVFEGPSGLIGASMNVLSGQDMGAPPLRPSAPRCDCHGHEVCPASHPPYPENEAGAAGCIIDL